MKWVVRSCWLLAWSLWLLLGVGLHHELPRNLGPAVCRIPLAPYQNHSAHVAGFDGPSRVVVAELPANGPKFVAVYNAETGACINRFPVSNLEWRWTWRDCALHHGCFIVNEHEHGGLRTLDLASGIWTTLHPRDVQQFTVHPTEPLIATRKPTDLRGRRLAVYDLKRHQLVFESKQVLGGELDTPIFVPGTDKLLLMRSTHDKLTPVFGTRVVVCTITPPGAAPNAELFDGGPPDRGWATTSHTGRAAFGAARSGAFEVFDFTQDRVVFARPQTPPGSQSSPYGATQNPPALSANGRTVIGDWPQTLWDIDRGVPLWQARSFDFVFPDLHRAAAESVGTRFFVLERWSELWKRWLPNFQYTTFACRDMRDGSLVYRIPAGSGDGKYNADWSLVVAGDDGSIYRLPPRVNWLLLALCQAILALPLILLWSLLRVRRRRTAQRQLAGAAQVSNEHPP